MREKDFEKKEETIYESVFVYLNTYQIMKMLALFFVFLTNLLQVIERRK